MGSMKVALAAFSVALVLGAGGWLADSLGNDEGDRPAPSSTTPSEGETTYGQSLVRHDPDADLDLTDDPERGQ